MKVQQNPVTGRFEVLRTEHVRGARKGYAVARFKSKERAEHYAAVLKERGQK